MSRNVLALWIGLAATAATTACAQAGQTLDVIRDRGQLACGVSENLIGLMHTDGSGNWKGLSTDVCRAVAVALFGDVGKVEFVTLDMSKQYSALRSGLVDVLASSSTFTLQRDTVDGADLAGVYYYDRQGLMVPLKSGKRRVEELDGTSVCVEADSVAELAVADHFWKTNMTFTPVAFDRVSELQAAFFAGKCDVFASSFRTLHVTRSAYAPNPSEYVILPTAIAKVPIGLAVRQDDHQFADVARWALYAMIEAEEYDITSRNVAEFLKSENSAIKRLLGVVPGMGKSLGIADTWAYEIVRQVGNYAEVYDRSLGPRGAVNIPRALNLSWRAGGMLYAPPIR
jgi:general L-amino acid transport system substrate-binding protein